MMCGMAQGMRTCAYVVLGGFGTPRVEAHPELEGQQPGDKLRVGDDQFAVVG